MMKHVRTIVLMLICAGLDVRAERREFRYRVDAEIDSSGVVRKADVVSDEVSSSFEKTLVGLVKQWRFRPATRLGRAVSSRTTLTTDVVIEFEDFNSARVTARYAEHGPRYKKNPAPKYPQTAIDNRTSAEVIVLVSIDGKGRVSSTELYSLHMTRESPEMAREFIDASTATIDRWRFVPERVDGEGVQARLLVPIRFSIGDAATRKWKFAMLPSDATETQVQGAAKKFGADSRRFVVIENSTGLELLSDGAAN